MSKYVLIIIWLFLFPKETEAQSEFYIPWNDSFSLDEANHVADNYGNIFVLSVLYDTVYTIEGFGVYGNACLKIDRNNNVVWKKLYNNYFQSNNIFLYNGYLLIPYSPYFGVIPCDTLPNGIVQAQDMSLNGAITADITTGDTINNLAFYYGEHCGLDGIYYCYIDGGNMDIIYRNDSASGLSYHNMVIDRNFNVITDTPMSVLDTSSNHSDIYAIVYDSIDKKFVAANTSGIQVYDSKWNLLFASNLGYIGSSYEYMGSNICITYNAGYYAINYELYKNYKDTPTYYVAVLTKDGNIVSAHQSLFFNSILLTADDHILGVSSQGNYTYVEDLFQDTTQKPIILEEMDIFQNIIRKISLGKPGIIADKISLTNDNNVVITGTYELIWRDSFPQPDEVYYYRQSLNEIPLLINDKSICTAIEVYPNPAKNTINIMSYDFNATYNATIELYNILGQKVFSTVFDTKTFPLDLTTYPAGMYFLKTRNSSSSCVSKIEKQ